MGKTGSEAIIYSKGGMKTIPPFIIWHKGKVYWFTLGRAKGIGGECYDDEMHIGIYQ